MFGWCLLRSLYKTVLRQSLTYPWLSEVSSAVAVVDGTARARSLLDADAPSPDPSDRDPNPPSSHSVGSLASIALWPCCEDSQACLYADCEAWAGRPLRPRPRPLPTQHNNNNIPQLDQVHDSTSSHHWWNTSSWHRSSTLFYIIYDSVIEHILEIYTI